MGYGCWEPCVARPPALLTPLASRCPAVKGSNVQLFLCLKAEVHADNMGSRLLRRPAERSQNMWFLLENRSPSPLRLSSRVTRPLNIPVEVSGPPNFQTLIFQSWRLDLIQIWNTWSFLHQFLSNFGPIPCLLDIMLMRHFRLPFEVCHLPQQGVIFG